jgi:hypothetical protein
MGQAHPDRGREGGRREGEGEREREREEGAGLGEGERESLLDLSPVAPLAAT